MDQMADDIERAERVRPVVVQGPEVAEPAEQRAQDLGRALKDFDGSLEAEGHGTTLPVIARVG
jgi:hypothetical protein